MRDGTREAADGGEFFTLNESGFRPFLSSHLEDDSGDGLDFAVGTEDGGVADVPVAVFAGTGGEFAFEEEISDGIAFGNLLEGFSEALERSEVGDDATKNLLARQAESLTLTIVDAQVAEFNRIEDCEPDGRGKVDVFELGALTFGLLLSTLERLGEGFAVVYVDGDAEPVENFA